MKRFINNFVSALDKIPEFLARPVAQKNNLRCVLSFACTLMLRAVLLPVLSFGSHVYSLEPANKNTGNDPASCDYWRYCAIDGNLCNDCGGTLSACPPGSEVSVISWTGTCRNPNDGKDYLIAYHDCCGKAVCRGKECVNNVRERPAYNMGLNNDVSWCMANTSQGYHCTLAAVVGVVD